MLRNMIIASIVRRIVGYLGVGGLVGFDNDLTQVAGAGVAALTLAWSLVEKVRAYRKSAQ